MYQNRNASSAAVSTISGLGWLWIFQAPAVTGDVQVDILQEIRKSRDHCTARNQNQKGNLSFLLAFLVKKAIEELEIINRDKPSMKLWRIYLKSLEHIPANAEERQALEPLIRKDYELAALYARVHSRLGEVDAAIYWLELSVAGGNLNLV